jgi:hypothetical protein
LEQTPNKTPNSRVITPKPTLLLKEQHPLEETPNSRLMTPKPTLLGEGHYFQQTPNSRLTTPKPPILKGDIICNKYPYTQLKINNTNASKHMQS